MSLAPSTACHCQHRHCAVSMAATATATASSPFCNRIHNLSITHSSISLSPNFPQTLISPKPLTLKPHLFTPSPLSPYHLLLPSVSFNGFQVTQHDPEAQTFQKSKPKVSHSNQSCRLFVGNLPYSLPSSQLAELFGEAGNVVSVEIVYDDITDRSRGFAFVTMGSIEDAKQAIQMFDGSQVGGRIVKVHFSEVPKGGGRLVKGSKLSKNYRGYVDSPHKIYAGNLGWGLTSQGLRDAFAEQRGLLSAKVIYERDNGKSQGYGFVTFETAEDVEAALNAMNGVEVQGRPLRLNLAANKNPSSPVIDENTGSNISSLEFLFSVST